MADLAHQSSAFGDLPSTQGMGGWPYARPVGEGMPSDITPPSVSDFSPAPGTPISVGSKVAFSVTDNLGAFSTVAVLALFPNLGIYEVVHDGTAFGPAYSANGIRQAIANGWRYTLLRDGGWPRDTLKIRLIVRDADGNLVTL